jgi:hypothetical protein
LTAIANIVGLVVAQVVFVYLVRPLFGFAPDEQSTSVVLQLTEAPLYAVGGAIAGAGQWLVLRRLFPRAGWWVLATAGGWMAGSLWATAGPILKVPHETIQAGWLDAGAPASLVDFDSYWHPAALKEVDKFCTDDHAQLQHYIQAGYFQIIPPVHADLGELAVGKKAGRETVSERTMAANLGLAMDDIAVAPAIYQRALEKGIGRWMPR